MISWILNLRLLSANSADLRRPIEKKICLICGHLCDLREHVFNKNNSRKLPGVCLNRQQRPFIFLPEGTYSRLITVI